MVDRLRTSGVEGVSDVMLGRCAKVLEVQRDELRDIVVHIERGRYPALSESPSSSAAIVSAENAEADPSRNTETGI